MTMRFLTFPQLKTEKGIPDGRRNLYLKEAAGRFPKRIKLSPGKQGRVVWVESEVDAHIERIVAQRDQAAE
jgi:predicted DNA-binding transcriptional regulator AlpA